MNLDRFLEFWSHHNQTIIQSLIVVTLVFIVALVFITLFGSKNDDTGAAQVGLSPELEKSLQKMLENQTKAAVFDFTKPQEGAPSSIATAPGAVNPESAIQLEKLKAEVALKEKKIQDLNVQLSQAVTQATKQVDGGNTSGLDARIKELEARLAEYDIISEDIADLSRYKDENEKIKAELSALRNGVVAAAVAAAPAAVQQAVAAVVTPPPVMTAAPPPQAAPEMPPAKPVVEVTPPQAEADTANAAIDDDLMKEFAAAVEGQKAATQVANIPAPNSDSEELMGQFENFVQKKEGS